ncbi:uracil-DNA glycosylase family protein [Pseudotamlana agarivorans]|uniref:uracil-DNA glycosylase family protein n=1 Tax=Pseudotamlana agarivorans TaxID=481183 RepID=UPI00082E8395|nr:uracil-DNA glycosylase family protein [Tamlana agarivorans]
MKNSKLQNSIIELLSTNVIKTPKEQLDSIYSAWQKGEKASEIEIDGLPITTLHRNSLISDELIPKGTGLLGVDLPYWEGDFENSQNKIMIIGIDPLRDENAFKKAGANTYNHVLLSSPFAYHANKKSSFKTFINHLAENNFIYLTDVYKTFFSKGLKAYKSYNYYNKKTKEFPQITKMLFNEIKLIEPDLIITLGADTYKQLTKSKGITLTRNIMTEQRRYHEGIPTLPLMHISGCYAHHLKSFLEINEIDSKMNIGLAYFILVKKFLDNMPMKSH